MPLSTIHQRDQTLRLTVNLVWWLSGVCLIVSWFLRFFFLPAPTKMYTLPPPSAETLKQKAKSSGTLNQHTNMRSPCPLNCFQLLLPHHWHRNKWAVFYQSRNVQTCEFNQVRRRLWLKPHAAFLSSDLITRLFSPALKKVGCTGLRVVLGYTFWGLLSVWCRKRTWEVSVAPMMELIFNAACAFKACSMGTTYKLNYCSQQMEAWGGGMISRCWNSSFGSIWILLEKESKPWR